MFFGFLFCSCVIGFLLCFFFAIKVSAPIPRSSLPHSRRVPGLGLALVSTDLWSQRWSRGVHGTEISIQICAWLGFEPWTSHLAVQHTRPQGQSLSIIILTVMTKDTLETWLNQLVPGT